MVKKLIIKTILVILQLLLVIPLRGEADHPLTGRIMNNGFQPVKNVSVNYEGAPTAPVLTDSLGNFELLLPSGDEWLIIKPVGDYKEKRVYTSRRSHLMIYLAESGTVSGDDEIAFPGIRIRRKELVSSTIFLDEPGIYLNSAASFDQDLHGKLAGLHQVGLSGMPGTGTYMLIMGMNSINTTNQPLIVVDGMPLETPGLIGSLADGYSFNPAASLNPVDISTISVVKDGATLASYGLKGSNGIIFIETLKPTNTKTSIDFLYKTGIHFVEKQLPQLDSRSYKTLATDMLTTSDIPQEEFAIRYPGLFNTPDNEQFLRYSHNTNWQDRVIDPGWMQDACLSVKGGDAIARYGLSIGYLNHQGTVQNSDYNRFSTRFVGTFNIFRWLRMYASANLVSSKSNSIESALLPQSSPMLTALHKTPQMDSYAYDQEGNRLGVIDPVDELGISNPTAVVDNYSAANSNDRFLTTLRVEGDLGEYLRWNSLIGLNINDVKQKTFMPNQGMELYVQDEAYNVSMALNNQLFVIYNDNVLTYRRLFNRIHDLRVSGGFRWQINEYQDDFGISMNANENDQYTNLGLGDNDLRNIVGENAKWNWLSNYLSAAYTFRDKYLLDASVSGDFSSNVGKEAGGVARIGEVPFGIFYSAGAAWRISSESFMKGVKLVDDLKLRLNWSSTGNDDIGTHNSYAYYQLKLYRETSGMVPGGLANEFLKFERTGQFTMGVDLTVMENRLRFSGNYFRGHTTDMLIYQALASYMGYDLFPSNNASLHKRGYDFQLSSRLFRRGKFFVDLGLTLGHYESIISSVPDGKVITKLPGGAEIVNMMGAPANSYYGYLYEGVFASVKEAGDAGLVNRRGIPFWAGDARYSDLSGPQGIPDGVIDDWDKTILGSATPEIYGGVTINLTYGRWYVGMLWQFVSGHQLYNYMRQQNEKMDDLSNQSVAVLRRWTYDGQETDIPRALWGDPVGNSEFSSRWIEDGSYARMKQITFSYRIPEQFLFFRSMNLFITGTNLLTFTNYLSYDPEFSYSFDSALQGVDYGLMPMGRKIIAGIRFGI